MFDLENFDLNSIQFQNQHFMKNDQEITRLVFTNKIGQPLTFQLKNVYHFGVQINEKYEKFEFSCLLNPNKTLL